jgi:pimeloyl-ACP methyl ester carboxylesterase
MLIDNYKYWGPTPVPIPEVWPTPPTAERISAVKTPTLIIIGDKDAENVLQIADILARDIPGAKKVVMANVSHHLNMEKPKEFNEIVLRFLRSAGDQ